MLSKYIPKQYMPFSEFIVGESNTGQTIGFKNPLYNDGVKRNTSRYANIVKNVKQPKIVINPIENNKILPGWVSLTKANGHTEIAYGIERKRINIPDPVETYDELLDKAYCRTQQRYWDNDIKLKGALSLYYGRQTLDEWAKQAEEEYKQQQMNTEINEKLINENKVLSIRKDIEMKRIKKNARIIVNDIEDTSDTRNYQSD